MKKLNKLCNMFCALSFTFITSFSDIKECKCRPPVIFNYKVQKTNLETNRKMKFQLSISRFSSR